MEKQEASCPCLGQHVKQDRSLQGTVSGQPGSEAGEPMWVRELSQARPDQRWGSRRGSGTRLTAQ